MKKFLAMTLVVLITVASGFAETAKKASAITSGAFVNKAAVQKAAAAIKPTPALVTGAVTNYVPLFTDVAGDLTSSVISQSGTNIGIGTATPATAFNVVGANPTLRVDNYSNVAGDSPNFNFFTARGTAAAPLATQLNDNLGQYAANGYNGSAFPASTKVKVIFLATENWTPTANGTAMAFQTTANGTIVRAERLRIDNSGNVGIGTPTPTALLEVNGTAKFDGLATFASGQVFPGAVASVSAADTSITVLGTPSAPTLAVNTAVIQARVSGTCGTGTAMTAVSQTGTVTCVPILSGTPSNVPVIETLVTPSITGGSGLSAASTIFTADADAFYRVSVYMNSPLGGTCASAPCTGEQVVLTWSDGISMAAQAATTCSLAGPCSSSFSAPIWVANGTPIQAYSQPTGSGTAPTGTFTARFLVEKL